MLNMKSPQPVNKVENRKGRNRLLHIACLVLPMFFASCAVGPDYSRPTLPDIKKFARQQTAEATESKRTEAEFWRTFGDPLLVKLVEDALQHNHDLRVSYASYQEANALLRDASFEKLPILSANAGASHTHTTAERALSGRRDYDSYQADIGAIWEPDFFGRIRRSIEAQRAETEATAADVGIMQIVIVSELVNSYLQLRGLQEQLRIFQEFAENQIRSVSMMQARYNAGQGTRIDIDRTRALLETTRSRIPALKSDIAVSTHRIAVLTGKLPAIMISDLEKTTAFKHMVAPEIAIDTPANLLQRRPDVIAAERRLAASSERIGVATADLFPRFTLSGLIGTQALAASELFQQDSHTRMLTLGVGGPFLNIGQVRARIASADANMERQLALYERTVLKALEETENALVRISHSELELQHLQDAAQASEHAVTAARAHFDSGLINALDVLDSERTSLQAESDYALGWTRHMQTQVSLYKALSGGWTDYESQNNME